MIKFIEEDEDQRNFRQAKEVFKDVFKEEAFERMFTILKETLKEERKAFY